MIRILSFLLFLFLLFPPNASAQVVINEFSSWETSGDWVELYSPEDVDISGWIIRDTATTAVKTLPENTFIGPSYTSYLDIDVGRRLNKDGDVIKFLIADDITLVDQISYGDQGGVCAPLAGQSAGRYPDANSTIERFASPTRGSSNDPVILDPCPTPTPEPTPTPSPTPKPISTPKPTSTPTPTKTPTPSPTGGPTVKAAATKKPTVTTKSVSENEEEGKNDVVLGLREGLNSAPPSPGPEPEAKGKFPITAVFFIIFGVGFTGFAGYSLLKAKKERYNKVSERKKERNSHNLLKD